MNILDLYLYNSAGKLCRVPALTWRWWILAALIGVVGGGIFFGGLILLSIVFGY